MSGIGPPHVCSAACPGARTADGLPLGGNNCIQALTNSCVGTSLMGLLPYVVALMREVRTPDRASTFEAFLDLEGIDALPGVSRPVPPGVAGLGVALRGPLPAAERGRLQRTCLTYAQGLARVAACQAGTVVYLVVRTRVDGVERDSTSMVMDQDSRRWGGALRVNAGGRWHALCPGCTLSNRLLLMVPLGAPETGAVVGGPSWASLCPRCAVTVTTDVDSPAVLVGRAPPAGPPEL